MHPDPSKTCPHRPDSGLGPRVWDFWLRVSGFWARARAYPQTHGRGAVFFPEERRRSGFSASSMEPSAFVLLHMRIYKAI